RCQGLLKRRASKPERLALHRCRVRDSFALKARVLTHDIFKTMDALGGILFGMRHNAVLKDDAAPVSRDLDTHVRVLVQVVSGLESCGCADLDSAGQVACECSGGSTAMPALVDQKWTGRTKSACVFDEIGQPVSGEESN